MSSPVPGNDAWVVFGYEADMLLAMCNLLVPCNQEFALLSGNVRNAVVESALLHTRQLVDILLSRGSGSDDINLATLVPNHQPARLEELRQAYGNRNTEGSPCWTINKMLAHATTQRSSSFDYSSMLNGLAPIVADIVQDVRSRCPGGGLA